MAYDAVRKPRRCWHRGDILIPPPRSVVEQKTSCCAKTCRVTSVIARKIRANVLCAHARSARASHLPTVCTDTLCCQLYIWPRSTLEGTGVISQHLAKYKCKHMSNATMTKTCIHTGQAAATHLFKCHL